MARDVRVGTLAAGPTPPGPAPPAPPRRPAGPRPTRRAGPAAAPPAAAGPPPCRARAHPPLTTLLWLKNPRNPRKFLPLQCS